MKYKDPRSLEMAIKNAAVLADMDTNKAIEGFYFDRFLCRVFSEEEPVFVLKGGQSMLARTISARTTRDIDLVSHSLDIDEAVEELKRISAINLGDYIRFLLESVEPIKGQDEYRSGYKVFFQSYLGVSKKVRISVDLVCDEVLCGNSVKMNPISRLVVGDLETSDYLLYPICNTIADKVCAIMEFHDGRSSSRIKDLVDLAVIFTTQEINADELHKKIHLEAKLRKLPVIEEFSVPAVWTRLYGASFSKLAKETGLSPSLQSLEGAFKFVAKCLDSILIEVKTEMHWDPELLMWQDKYIDSLN